MEKPDIGKFGRQNNEERNFENAFCVKYSKFCPNFISLSYLFLKPQKT
jgi:hypothetical protein